MAGKVFFGSVVLCLLFTGLSQVSDPGVLRIRGEPARVLYYGGSGLLVGVFALVALGSGIYLGITRFQGVSVVQRRVVLSTMLLVLIAALIILVIRFYPG
ncbi:MAG: hypothetical protein OER98_01485 [Gammaproteobacteria bacterium]|nr:hypothetical protein [Gammaproteobacteria bacterium]